MASPTAVPDWRTVFPENERRIYEAARFGGLLEPGRRPAVMVIDVVESFAGRPGEDILDAIGEYRTSCGPAGEGAIEAIGTLLDTARATGVPVVYTKGSVVDKFHSGDSVKGTRPEEVASVYGAPIVSRIAPLESEYVLEKTKASAFFGTPMTSFLQRHGVDTLLVCGTSTSGCVRASVVDGFSHGYRVWVVEDCVFDRAPTSHAVNLYEMNQKYASVVTLDDACRYLHQVQKEQS
ncbi:MULTISPECIES: isochorismatase family protein [Pseudonocardia]|jgi:nicotinamidase-related amidase|uniref:isochorismatase family protein n=1 Tax=Pseudonocardia TaxID=1847 RepID=UPI000CD1A0E8|nr:isochorismatase family protein [Pseudonocardia dioxanivorans]GJF06279.1 hydrolase [Pseudonocardia sp. D17]